MWQFSLREDNRQRSLIRLDYVEEGFYPSDSSYLSGCGVKDVVYSRIGSPQPSVR